jgi:hypothetical protein
MSTMHWLFYRNGCRRRAVHMALLPAQRFVAALAEAGLRIPDYRPDAAGSIARAVAHGDRGLALVH